MVNCPVAYKGVTDCFCRILKEEGVGAFYRSLPPRLMSVVPMIAIQFSAYEVLKKKFVHINKENRIKRIKLLKRSAAALVIKAKSINAKNSMVLKNVK